MSYQVWSTDGYGFCVDDIHTTPQKVMALAATNAETLKYVCEYLDEHMEEEHCIANWETDDLQMSDFDDLCDDCGCARGISYILSDVIKYPVTVADNFEGEQFILIEPYYPWSMPDELKGVTEEDVKAEFQRCISMLTDEDIYIYYQSVPNGG